MNQLKEPTTNQAFLVIDLVDEGTPIKEAAQAAGVTVQQARAMAGNETLRKAVKELTTEDKYKAYELHEKGWSDARIARQLTTTKVKVIKAIAAIRDKKLKKCVHCQWRKDGWEICCLPVCLRGVGKIEKRRSTGNP